MMVKKIKNMLMALTAVSFVLVPVFAGPAVFAAAGITQAQINGQLCSGTNFDLNGAMTDCSSGGATDFNKLLTNIVNIFSAVVGVIAVIMIIVGGLRYITSGGDTGNVSTAKTTIIYALVGLVIVALAQLIVHFVFQQSSNIAGS